MSPPLCLVVGCGRASESRPGWCHAHYEFWRRTGTAPTRPILDTPEKRLWAKVNKAGPVPVARPDLGPCWLWVAAADGQGRYGAIHWEGRLQRAHRVVYELLVGPIETSDLDHLCRVTLCVNPNHLEPVTHRENVMRGNNVTAMNARKTHCIRGHDLSDPANVRVMKTGGRQCRPCGRIRYAERKAAGTLPLRRKRTA